MELNDLLPIYRLAEQAHHGQVDKAGEPYICHCVRVALSLLPDIEAAAVGLLHDVLEDTELTALDLMTTLSSMRVTSKMIASLCWLHHLPDMSYEDYIESIVRSPLARKVKLADLRDNLNPRRIEAATAHGNDMTALVDRYQNAVARLEAIPAATR